MDWRTKKQLTLFSVFAVLFIFGVGFFLYKTQPVASCFDNKQNQDETGVDCGGSQCPACLTETPKDLITLWTRFFQIRPGIYEVASLIENPNVSLGVKNLAYTIRLLDEDGKLISIRQGSTYVVPSSRFLAYETNIETGARVPKRVTFTLKPFSWVITQKPSVAISIVKTVRHFDLDRPQLLVTLGNSSINNIGHVDLQVVLVGSDGNAVAVASSQENTVTDSSTADIIFTWPRPFTQGVSSTNVYVRQNPW